MSFNTDGSDTFDFGGINLQEAFQEATQEAAANIFEFIDREKLQQHIRDAALKLLLKARNPVPQTGTEGSTSGDLLFQGQRIPETVEELKMAVPMILALTICPAMLGTQEAIRQSQSKNKREEHRARRCNLVVSCVKQSIRSRDINQKLVVLKDNKLYIAGNADDDEDAVPASTGYPFSGYFLPYPDSSYEGMVSTISDDPPMLNWIYVDKDTYELKYGLRVDAQDNITGPFDCTRQDRRMTMEGWEGFCAVEEYPGVWALYFDRDDDGLTTKVPMGTRVLEIELTRREKKERKPQPDPLAVQTLDEKMRQHKEQTQREEEEREKQLRTAELGGQDPDAAQAATVAAPQTAHEEVEIGPEPPTTRSETEIGEEDMGNLSINTEAHADDPPQVATISPSAATDSMSFWSRARRPGDNDDQASVTAASSIGERMEAVEVPSVGTEKLGYRSPYVEEDFQDRVQIKATIDI
ncbi:hypothetical protein F5Y15DRAFT_23890 [Xylariaceae sp. FL0016]|nr:hypothetical protein F5Y15DRAFT_23890 [Xylariaceae sp. FL0016]